MVVSSTTSEVGVPRAQGRARIRLVRVRRHARQANRGAESACMGAAAHRRGVDAGCAQVARVMVSLSLD